MTRAARTNRWTRPYTTLPTTLSLGSGGSRGVCMLGALSTLQRQGWLDDVTSFYGCSVGSIIATGLCLGASCNTLKKRVAKNPIVLDTPPERVMSNSMKFGMHGSQHLLRFIKRVTKVGHRTFQDVFQQTGHLLVVVVCNVSTGAIEHWSHHTHPSTKICTALCLSCRVPFVFTHGTYGGQVYVDGGVGEPVPHTPDPMSTLAVSFVDHIAEPIQSIVEYTRSLLSVAIRYQAVRWRVEIDPGQLSPFDFAMDHTTVKTAYVLGKRQGATFCKKNT